MSADFILLYENQLCQSIYIILKASNKETTSVNWLKKAEETFR